MQLTTNLAETLKPKPDQTHLGFGTIFTDHMLNMDYPTPPSPWTLPPWCSTMARGFLRD